MKPKSMTSFIAKSVAVLAACAALNASAGTAPVKNPAPPVVEESGALFDSIGATFDAGYDSRYYFRGLWFADNIMWTALNISVPITDKLTWGIGGTYINTAGTPFPNFAAGGVSSKSGFQYSEIDAITSLAYDAGWAKFGMQYQYYFYPDNYGGSFNGVPNAGADPEFGLKGAGELGFTAVVPIKGFNIYAGYYYDFRINGSYLSLGADYTFKITDWLSIVPSVNTGFGIDYYTGNGSGSIPGGVFVGNNGQSMQNAATSGFTHVLYTIAVPVKLTKSVTWTTYAALNHSEKLRTQINFTQNEIYWGTKLSFAF
jgi:hypothetical protein